MFKFIKTHIFIAAMMLAAFSAQAREFIHPGVLHTSESIDRMKALVEAKV